MFALPDSVPDLRLTQGQLLWAINYGRDPDDRLRHHVRYLRALDIPPASKRQANGPGKRISYDFFDLVEAGVAVTALDLGFRPKDIAEGLLNEREKMRRIYRDTWVELPDGAVDQDWVKSRGRVLAMLGEEIFISLHDRRSERWGRVDFVGPDEVSEALPMFEPVERFEGEAPRRLLPLKRLMLQWVAWALDAPPIRPGRR